MLNAHNRHLARLVRACGALFVLGPALAAGCGTDGAPGPSGPPGSPGEDAVLDPSLSPVEKAFAALGGKDAVTNLATFRLEAAGVRYFPGEEYNPSDPAPEASTYQNVTSYDV